MCEECGVLKNIHSFVNHNCHNNYRQWYCILFVIGLRKKIISVRYINLAAIYVKMLYYNKIDVLEETDSNKSNKSKECMICHY